MDGIQPQSSEAPKIAFVDGQFVNQGVQGQEATPVAPENSKVAVAGAEIASANPFDAAKEPAISEASAESNDLVNDFINNANASGVDITEAPVEPTITVAPEVTPAEPMVEMAQTPPDLGEIGEVADTAWQADAAEEATPEPVEAKVETPAFDKIVEDPEELLEEINEGFDTMVQKLDSYLDSLDKIKKENKEAIAEMEAELEQKTKETKEAIKAKNVEISELTRKEEMAKAQKKRILLVQNPQEEIQH